MEPAQFSVPAEEADPLWSLPLGPYSSQELLCQGYGTPGLAFTFEPCL